AHPHSVSQSSGPGGTVALPGGSESCVRSASTEIYATLGCICGTSSQVLKINQFPKQQLMNEKAHHPNSVLQ
ncbi:MAG: hypothetical protein ACREXM_02340, partial [Gammaproteobacteria bacterium]